jgi:hypothetical protein
MTLQTELQKFTNETREALNNKLYRVALLAVITLPDICTSLNPKKNASIGEQYAKWYDQHVEKQRDKTLQGVFNGKDCWQLRCSIIHELSTHTKGYYQKALITLPAPNTIHLCTFNQKINLDIKTFTLG